MDLWCLVSSCWLVIVVCMTQSYNNPLIYWFIQGCGKMERNNTSRVHIHTVHFYKMNCICWYDPFSWELTTASKEDLPLYIVIYPTMLWDRPLVYCSANIGKQVSVNNAKNWRGEGNIHHDKVREKIEFFVSDCCFPFVCVAGLLVTKSVLVYKNGNEDRSLDTHRHLIDCSTYNT